MSVCNISISDTVHHSQYNIGDRRMRWISLRDGNLDRLLVGLQRSSESQAISPEVSSQYLGPVAHKRS